MKTNVLKVILLFLSGCFAYTAEAQFPSVYDLRSLGQVSPVKDQGSCGSCWAFATIAAIESNWLKNGHSLTVLSEDNLIDCHGFDEAPCFGGSYYMSSALLSRHGGAFSLADDPYTPSVGNCPWSQPFPPSPVLLAEEIRWIPPVQNDIKQALTDHGAVATSMFFNMTSYNSSTFKYYDALIDATDSLYPHCVAIVGWNDTMSFAGAPANGGWIIKDSYGTSWAQNGYFFVSYYDAGILSDNVVFPALLQFPAPPDHVHAYYHDAFGWVDNYGWGTNIGYALVKYTLAPSGGVICGQQIKRIGTYAVEAGTTINIDLYRTKTGNTLGGLFASASLTCPQKGFYTLPFSLATDTLGSEIYIKIKYTCPAGTLKPLPVEIYEAGHTSGISLSSNACWFSTDNLSWNLIGQGTPYSFDLCVKMYTEDAPRAVMGVIQDTACLNHQVMLTDMSPMPRDSMQWLVNGVYHCSMPACPYACATAGDVRIDLVTYLGSNTDTATAFIHVVNADTALNVWNSVITSLASGVNYQWLDCDSGWMPISGETGQVYTAQQDGSYAVMITGWHCCDTSSCVSIFNAGTGDTEPLPVCSILPNPSDGRFFLHLTEAAQLEVFSINGTQLLKIDFAAGKHYLDLKETGAGICILRVTTVSSAEIRKLIIRK